MPERVKGRRLWIKLYPIDCLDGSIRYQLEPDERSVWYDLLNFSALCANPGTIADKDGRPYPHSFIANRLNIGIDLLERSLDKCREEGRIREEDGGIIEITHWNSYQNEYQRQKPYRQKKDMVPLPAWIDKETWDGYLEMRGKIHSPPTAHAQELVIKALERFRAEGMDPKEILNQSIMNGWRGVFPLKEIKNGTNRETYSVERLKESIGKPLDSAEYNKRLKESVGKPLG